ncbi:MAG: hypothetical protein RLZZ209_206 [Bacteroidota bacterium]
MKKIILLFAVLFAASCSTSNKDYQKAAANPEFLIRAEVMLTESIIHDIFAPPVSSRIYMYAKSMVLKKSLNLKKVRNIVIP